MPDKKKSKVTDKGSQKKSMTSLRLGMKSNKSSKSFLNNYMNQRPVKKSPDRYNMLKQFENWRKSKNTS